MKNSNDIDIFLSSDENYSYPLGVCLVSILENNTSVFDNINFHILDNNMKKESINKINSLKQKYNCNFTFYSMKQIENIFPKDIKDNPTFKRLGYSAFGRLFINRLIKENGLNLEKILYLDCDIIVDKSLKELWNINIDDYYLAAVVDEYSKEHNDRLKTFNFNKIYFNAGVLIINLKIWRLRDIENDFIDILKEQMNNLPFGDQDILNLVLGDKIKLIDLKYNVHPEVFFIEYNRLFKILNIQNNDFFYSKNEYYNASKNPTIIHYHGASNYSLFKKNCIHPYIGRFKYYKELSPFKDTPQLENGSSLFLVKLKLLMLKYLPVLIVKKLIKYTLKNYEK